MRKLDIKAKDHLLSSEGKRNFNEKHFAEAAGRYDLATKMLSFGQDASWKYCLIRGLPDQANPFCLDLACGTGDITFLLAKKYPDGEILGVDLTREMIQISTDRNSHSHVKFSVQDMGNLNLADETVDILTGSYAIRNAPDLDGTLMEFSRVLKPGGHVAFLDFSKPVSKPAQTLQYIMLRIWGGLIGLILHQNTEVHGYIAESLRTFPNREELKDKFSAHGFEIEKSTTRLFGLMALHFLILAPKS